MHRSAIEKRYSIHNITSENLCYKSYIYILYSHDTFVALHIA